MAKAAFSGKLKYRADEDEEIAAARESLTLHYQEQELVTEFYKAVAGTGVVPDPKDLLSKLSTGILPYVEIENEEETDSFTRYKELFPEMSDEENVKALEQAISSAGDESEFTAEQDKQATATAIDHFMKRVI